MKAQRKFAQELQPKFVNKTQPNECIFLINYNLKLMNQSKFEGNSCVTYSFHKVAKLNIESIGNSSQSTLPEAMQGRWRDDILLKTSELNYIIINIVFQNV